MRVDTTDIRKSVMSEGDWHIVPAEHVVDWISFDRESVIVHNCHEWRSPEDNFGRPYPKGAWDPLTYWTLPHLLYVQCPICHMHPPEAIASLWLLHNFDAFAGEDPLSRSISEALKKAFYHYGQMAAQMGLK